MLGPRESEDELTGEPSVEEVGRISITVAAGLKSEWLTLFNSNFSSRF